MNTKLFQLISVIYFFLIISCARLDHVMIGEIDNTHQGHYSQFNIKVSEMGINIDEVAHLSKSILNNPNNQKQIEQIQNIIQMFQWGPRTGNPVYNEKYAENIRQLISNKCPSGNITGLTSIREAMKYPAISGEIIKITGYCYQKN